MSADNGPDTEAVRARRLGRLSAAERAAALCDPGTFAREHATLRGLYSETPPGDGLVCGTGLADGRPIKVIATDGRILRGTLGHAAATTATRLLEDARRAGHPVALLLDSDGARQSEGPPAVLANAGLLGALADLGGHVPRLAALFGAAGGSAAYALALCDLAVGVDQRSFAFVAGPAVVAQALGEVTTLAALGGTELHRRTGLLHEVAPDDGAAIAWLRRALTYLPGSAAELPPPAPPLEPAEPGAFEGLLPDDPKRAWDLGRALARLVDHDTFLELGAAFGPAIRTGFARMNGRALLVVASSPADLSGAIDAAAARKLASMVRLAAAFNLPILTLCDTPGFLPGTRQEAAAILCHGAAVIAAYCEARRSVPRVALIVRRAVGAGSVLAADADIVLALPGAVIAQMGPEALAAASAVAGIGLAPQPTITDPEAAGFAHRTIAPAAARAEIVRAFERLGPVTSAPPGQRKTALLPL